MIYLIGESGAASTPSEVMAEAMVQIAGYRRCTEDEYWQQLREIKAVDTAVAERNLFTEEECSAIEDF